MKLYQSEAWLRNRYLRQRKSPEEIAKECNTTPRTIYRAITKFNLKR